MRSIHTKEDVLAVCREIAEQEGPERLTRDAVQGALRARAERLGQRPMGADHRLVGEVLELVREELRQARVGAARAASEAAATALPDLVAATLARMVRDVEHACRQALAESEARGRAEADARVSAVDSALRGELTVTQTDLLLARREAQGLAQQLDELTSSLERERQVAAELSVEIAEKTAALSVREQETRDQFATLTAQVELAHQERAGAQKMVYASEEKAVELRAAVIGLERDLAVALVERDLARGRVAELEERAAALEARVEELTGAAAAATARCEELQQAGAAWNGGRGRPSGRAPGAAPEA